MLYLPALLLVAVVLVACAAAVLAVSREAEATFPGKNGRIAYERNLFMLYTINPNGSGKTKVTNTRHSPSLGDYSPDGKKITYTDFEGFNGRDTEIYTVNVGGGG